VHFAEKPTAPKWTTKVRYKTSASIMRGMGGMMGQAPEAQQSGQPGQLPKKKKKFGLGDVLKSVAPVPIP